MFAYFVGSLLYGSWEPLDGCKIYVTARLIISTIGELSVRGSPTTDQPRTLGAAPNKGLGLTLAKLELSWALLGLSLGALKTSLWRRLLALIYKTHFS